MAQEAQLAHRVIGNLSLPYITNTSPMNTDPHFVSGSTDILTSINGYAERRPGFATTVEATQTAFNTLTRLVTWDRLHGTFFVMASDLNASTWASGLWILACSKSMVVGASDAIPTLSATPPGESSA